VQSKVVSRAESEDKEGSMVERGGAEIGAFGVETWG
jgi:hypothetical protein